MRDLQELDQLLESNRRDVLSIALDVSPLNPDNQRANPACRIWLRKALGEIFKHAPREQRAAVGELIDRVLTRVDDHRDGRGLAIFAAPDLWQEYVLPFPLPNRARYGRPDLLPLLRALDEYEPYAILAVSRDRIQLIVAFLAQLELIDAEVLTLNTHAWRTASGRPPTFTKRAGTGAPRGAQTDTFDARVEEQERRFWRTAAELASAAMHERRIRRLVLVGPSAATAAVAGYLGGDAAVQLVATVRAPPHVSIPELKGLTLPAVLAEKQQRERDLVTTLIERAGKRDAVIGTTATLHALAEGRVHLVIADLGYDPVVWQCPRCGTTSGPERAECPTCGSPMARTRLLDTLPLLVRQHGAELEFVGPEAAGLLHSQGSVGAILRYNPSVGFGITE